MFSSKIKSAIKKVICSLLVVMTLCIGGMSVSAYATGNTSFKLSDSSINYTQKSNKQKILIYHSHDCEEYTNYSIVDAGNNLKEKLEKKGYVVDHLTDNFSKDYNTSYSVSRVKLKSMDLSQYSLIIDMHRDWGVDSNATNIGGKKLAKAMFVFDKSSPNYIRAKAMSNEIGNNMKQYGDIMREDYTYDSTSNNYFNQDLGNVLLLEMGNLHNSEIEVRHTITYLASSIDTYLK